MQTANTMAMGSIFMNTFTLYEYLNNIPSTGRGSTDNIFLSPDKLVGVLSRLMIWLKEYERFYYLCTFFDYSKNVYGLEPRQQPPITGNFGLIATMYNHFPPALNTHVDCDPFKFDWNKLKDNMLTIVNCLQGC